MYIELFFFHDEFFLFLGDCAGRTYRRERKEVKERRREAEREVEVAYTLQIHKSPCTTACLYAYIPFFFSFFPSFFFSRGEIGQDCQSPRLGRRENNKSKRGDRSLGGKGIFFYREGVFLLLLRILSSAYLPSLWRRKGRRGKVEKVRYLL